VAGRSASYEPRRSGASRLYRIVHEHWETFRADAGRLRDGEGLPEFVEDEFRNFLRCGWLAGGFARFRCGGCGAERLVAFSCKGRGFCPSCGGRRMIERAAHLVDAVLPHVPVRQWVLTLPPRLRYRLAWDHDLCRAVVGVFLRGVFAALRRRAMWDGLAGGRSGAVTVLQRFGGALNLNVHIHALVLDGCYTAGPGRPFAFHAVDELTSLDVAETLHEAQIGITRLLARWPRDDAGWVEEAPVAGVLAAASVENRAALGERRGQRVARVGEPSELEDPPDGSDVRCHARRDGFDLDASHVVPAGARTRLERLCRYILRPAVTSERLQFGDDGQVRWRLPRPWRDGTTHVQFDPCDFLGRLAVLVPRPRVNLLFYHGVLGARSAWRPAIVPAGAARGSAAPVAAAAPSSIDAGPTSRRRDWANLMRRSFGFDVLSCARCGGRLRLIALIHEADVIGRILTHLGLPAEVPTPQPARSPPLAPVFADI
jgi:hypothetical protein